MLPLRFAGVDAVTRGYFATRRTQPPFCRQCDGDGSGMLLRVDVHLRCASCLAVSAVLACGSEVVSAGDSSEIGSDQTSGATESSSSDSDSESESESVSDSTDEVDPTPPDGCVLDVDQRCITDSFGCSGGRRELGLDQGIEICSNVSVGPRTLGLDRGVAACGCSSPTVLEARDLDGDGADELLAGCSGSVIIWRGRLDGYFGCGQVHAVAGSPWMLWIRDVDEDGLDDLVTVGGEGFTSLLPAIAPGEYGIFEPLGELAFVGLYWPSSVSLDIDGGASELLTVWPQSHDVDAPILVWTTSDKSVSVEADLFATPTWRVARGDIDGDGWLDLVALGNQAQYWARGSEAGLGSSEPLQVDLDSPTYGEFGDLDGDGIDDLVLGGNPPEFRLGNGDGTFGPLTSDPDPEAPEDSLGGAAVVVRDFDGDGLADVVLGGGASYWNLWRSSDNGLRFDQGTEYESSLFAAGDYDGDGHLDLVSTPMVHALANGQITYWRNTR